MRISTSQIFDAGSLGIQNNQAELFKLQNQMSSGRRVLTPADDSVASAQALVVSQAKNVNLQYLDNQKNASSQLGIVDSQLNALTNLIQNVRERTLQAGNTILNDSDRQAIASELEARLGELVGIANSQNGSGDYLFSGYQGATLPFAINGAGAVVPPATSPPFAYAGDDGERLLQVSASRQIGVNVSGSDLFEPGSSQNLFQTLQNLIGALRTPVGGAGYTTAQFSSDLDAQLNNLDRSLNNVGRVQADVGTRMRELDSLVSTSADVDIQYQSTLSDLQDLDYAAAISDFTKKQMQLEAAQKSFSQISNLSLFKFL